MWNKKFAFGSLFVFVVILTIGIKLYLVNTRDYNDDAIFFIKSSVPIISSWDIEKMKPILTSDALTKLSTEKNKKWFKRLSELGQVKSFDEPIYDKGQKSINHNVKSDLLGFIVVCHFEIFDINGNIEKFDALFSITIIKTKESYLIQNLEIFPDKFY